MKKGTGSGQKGRKREEWKRSDALGVVFFSPLHLFSRPPLAVDDWGAVEVGRSVVRQLDVAVAAAAVVVVASTRQPTRKGGHLLVCRSPKSTINDGV